GALEIMLAGVIKARFQVAYFDIGEMEWKTGWINIPVAFLPPERKLMELRALMDRALDILREIARDLSRGYQESIIRDYNEFKSKLTGVIMSLNEFYAEDYKNITGAELPDALKLRFVEEYYKPYVDGLKIWRDVYTVRRIRMWTQRWIGWVMYRVAYGAVTKDDIEDLLSYVRSYAKLTTQEYNFIKKIADRLYSIASREYSPTPSQLATLAEYVKISETHITKVFEARQIPTEWRSIWREYIKVRPVADDIKSLLTTYRRALVYTTLPDELEKEILSYAKKINFGAEELKILQLRVQLEELILQAKEYLPTPSMLATLSEYLALPENLITETLAKRRVPEEWMKIWLTYVRVRPIKSDAKALLSTYIRAFRYGVVTKDQLEEFIKTLPKYGFSKQEIEFISQAVNLEEQIIQAREYIPTPYMLATMSEYMVIPKDLMNKVFEARHIPKEWIEIWMKYISIRPIADDVRGLLSTYRRALLYAEIPEDLAKRIEGYATMVGFTQTEWDILKLRVSLEELIQQSREYIPTPYSLATICEYLPEARKFFDEVMTARRVPPEWQELWAKYIDYRPIISEVNRMLAVVEDLYEYFAITEDAYRKVLESVKYLGWTDKEIEFMLSKSRYARFLRAYRELIGDVDRMVMLSEYSPRARDYALGQLYKMIDALPIDPETKEVLKEMWTQFIRVKPVYDEVKRYITDLINLYVEGLISDLDFTQELESLKEWGLSDDEIMFYKAIAGARRARKLKIPVV
ncbi:MAG: hypothetical protein JRC90_11560, partial [Deltaproteobacteria bacterium]|nr:hypothetical protein [Deltaproteobacteria bacterium]